jgi:hypothetical protein
MPDRVLIWFRNAEGYLHDFIKILVARGSCFTKQPLIVLFDSESDDLSVNAETYDEAPKVEQQLDRFNTSTAFAGLHRSDHR